LTPPACEQLGCEQLGCEQLGCEQLGCEQLGCEQLGCEQLGCEQLCSRFGLLGSVFGMAGMAATPSPCSSVAPRQSGSIAATSMSATQRVPGGESMKTVRLVCKERSYIYIYIHTYIYICVCM